MNMYLELIVVSQALVYCIYCTVVSTVLYERLCPAGEAMTEGDLLYTMSAAGSHVECCAQCASIQRCRATVWEETTATCNYYATFVCASNAQMTTGFKKKSFIPPGMAQLSPFIASVYYLGYLTRPCSMYDAYTVCKAKNAHLVAINTQMEQDVIADYITNNAPDCVSVWTGGYSPISGSNNMVDWTWNLTTTLQPLSYIGFAKDQPNGFDGIDFTIALMKNYNYAWVDYQIVPTGITAFWKHCFICEIEI